MALDLKTFRIRSTTAVVFGVVLLSSIYFSYYSFFALFFFISIWALKEFYDLVEKMNVMPFKGVGIFCGILTFLSIYSRLFNDSNNNFGLVFLHNLFYIIPFILAIQFLFAEKENSFQSFVFSISGIFYCIIPFALLVQIPISQPENYLTNISESYNYFKIMGIIFLIWANDTFAYIGGSLMGKNKMYEKVSPGKTWEGTIIGIILCIVVGFALNLNQTFSNNWLWPLIALFIGVFGTIGDLVESALKRKVGVKDSGKIMPGHGGILDRFDSLLFVSPFLFLIIKLLENLK